MGRPKEHDVKTAAALLAAAERIVESEGIEALSVRRVAEDVGTTTRAVYSVFGSKDGLVVALGRRAFALLGAAIDALPTTPDPAADLVEAGVAVFRRFAAEHPALFTIGVQRAQGPAGLGAEVGAEAADAFAGLVARVERLRAADLLGGRSAWVAATEFHALCEGLAAVELRGAIPAERAPWLWRDALGALVTGFASASSHPPPRGSRRAAGPSGL